MEKQNKYRHEYKYLISTAQLVLIQSRIKPLLSLDTHVGSQGYYNIRSLYFDDYDNHCYYQIEDGVNSREKFRIRIYNHSSDRITLESKRKDNGKVLKDSTSLSPEQCKILLSNDYLKDISKQSELLKRFTSKMQRSIFKPVVIVEYDRIPYVYKYGNVRVTFDINIEASRDINSFLEDRIHKRPIMPQGMHLLEVKWDDYLPDTIYQALMIDSLSQTSYSKYYFCRKLGQLI